MPQHPWGASTPEINAAVIETGSTGATWAAASAAWLGLANATLAAAQITGTQMAASVASISGIRSAVAESATPPFLSWLGTMAGIAFKQAAVTAAVAQSYGMTRTTMIPSVQSINNRVREAAAEASNFFGQNTPLIVALNAEYAAYTMQNATIGTTYGQVITAATLPVPIPPPPPLANAAKAAADAGQALSQAGQMVSQAGSQGASQAAQQASQGVSQGGNTAGQVNPMSAMGGMGQMTQLFSAPMQALRSAGGGMGNPLQSIQGLLSAPMAMFGQGGGLGDFLGGGSTGDAFTPMLTGAGSGVGLPVGSSGLGATGGAGGGFGAGSVAAGGGGGGGGGIGAAGSLGPGMAGKTETHSASPRSMLSGVTSPSLVNPTATVGGSPAGMPMAPGAAGTGASGRGRDSGVEVTAAGGGGGFAPVRRERTGAERDLFR